MKGQSGQKGYSLIEALVVVAIIGLVSLVTVPNFITMYRASKVKGAIRQFTSDIRNARQLAVTENRQMMMSLGTTAAERDRYWLYRDVDGSWEVVEPAGKTLEEATENTTVYFSGTDFPDSDTTDGKNRADIIFQRNGTVKPFPIVGSGQYPAITIKTDDDIPKPSYTVRVSAAGTVRVE